MTLKAGGSLARRGRCDRNLSQASVRQGVTPLRGVALEAALPFEVFKRAHDIAAVVAADGSHEVLKKLRPLAQRCLDRGEARALVARRLRNFGFEAALRADRHGHVIAGLGAEAAVRLQ